MNPTSHQAVDPRLASALPFKNFLVDSPIGRLGIVKAVQLDPHKRDVELVVVPGADLCVFVPLAAVESIRERRRSLSVAGEVAVAVTEPLRSRTAAERIRHDRLSALGR